MGLLRFSRCRALLALALLVSGCAGRQDLGPASQPAGRTSYRVGPLHVLIRPQQEVEMICRLRALGNIREGRVQGCYVPEDNMIVSTPDPYVLLHEFRHFFEGAFHD
jgi:hypothetical protein